VSALQDLGAWLSDPAHCTREAIPRPARARVQAPSAIGVAAAPSLICDPTGTAPWPSRLNYLLNPRHRFRAFANLALSFHIAIVSSLISPYSPPPPLHYLRTPLSLTPPFSYLHLSYSFTITSSLSFTFTPILTTHLLYPTPIPHHIPLFTLVPLILPNPSTPPSPTTLFIYFHHIIHLPPFPSPSLYILLHIISINSISPLITTNILLHPLISPPTPFHPSLILTYPNFFFNLHTSLH
jgi:hypothetical protein